MAKLNVNKWQASRRGMPYTPVMQMYLRQIRLAMFEAMRVSGDSPYLEPNSWVPDDIWGAKNLPANWLLWDAAIMAREWIARPAPSPTVDLHGYLMSFDCACEALGLDADHERVWMLAKIDECADFDTDQVYARIDWLKANPPDEQEEELFDAPRCVPELDQGLLFGFGEAV